MSWLLISLIISPLLCYGENFTSTSTTSGSTGTTGISILLDDNRIHCSVLKTADECVAMQHCTFCLLDDGGGDVDQRKYGCFDERDAGASVGSNSVAAPNLVMRVPTTCVAPSTAPGPSCTPVSQSSCSVSSATFTEPGVVADSYQVYVTGTWENASKIQADSVVVSGRVSAAPGAALEIVATSRVVIYGTVRALGGGRVRIEAPAIELYGGTVFGSFVELISTSAQPLVNAGVISATGACNLDCGGPKGPLPRATTFGGSSAGPGGPGGASLLEFSTSTVESARAVRALGGKASSLDFR